MWIRNGGDTIDLLAGWDLRVCVGRVKVVLNEDFDRMDTCVERKTFTVSRLQTTSTCLQQKKNSGPSVSFSGRFHCIKITGFWDVTPCTLVDTCQPIDIT